MLQFLVMDPLLASMNVKNLGLSVNGVYLGAFTHTGQQGCQEDWGGSGSDIGKNIEINLFHYDF